MRTTLSLLAACTLTTLTLTGCGTHPTANPTTPTPTVDKVQAAKDAAETALRTWFQVSAQCLADPPNTQPSCLDQASTDQVLQDDHQALATAQEYGFHYVGQITVVSVQSDNVVLDGVAHVDITACIDTTNYQAVDDGGMPVLPVDESRPLRHLIVVEVRNYAYPSAADWRVGEIMDLEIATTPC